MQKKYSGRIGFQILCGCLCVSVCMNVILICLFFCKGIKYEIPGTYIYEGAEQEDSLYLVFKDDGTYQLYRQFYAIASGMYVGQQDTTYILQEKNKEDCYVIYDGRNVVYYCEPMEEVKLYHKISKLPMYINIKEEDFQ